MVLKFTISLDRQFESESVLDKNRIWFECVSLCLQVLRVIVRMLPFVYAWPFTSSMHCVGSRLIALCGRAGQINTTIN